mgnify:CR=1 FL=1
MKKIIKIFVIFIVIGFCSCESTIPEGCIQCPYCKGERILNLCRNCNGYGKVSCFPHEGSDCYWCDGTFWRTCNVCFGYDCSFLCPMCLGAGYVKE